MLPLPSGTELTAAAGVDVLPAAAPAAAESRLGSQSCQTGTVFLLRSLWWRTRYAGLLGAVAVATVLGVLMDAVWEHRAGAASSCAKAAAGMQSLLMAWLVWGACCYGPPWGSCVGIVTPAAALPAAGLSVAGSAQHAAATAQATLFWRFLCAGSSRTYTWLGLLPCCSSSRQQGSCGMYDGCECACSIGNCFGSAFAHVGWSTAQALCVVPHAVCYIMACSVIRVLQQQLRGREGMYGGAPGFLCLAATLMRVLHSAAQGFCVWGRGGVRDGGEGPGELVVGDWWGLVGSWGLGMGARLGREGALCIWHNSLRLLFFQAAAFR